MFKNNKDNIYNLTNLWIDNVTYYNDPELISDMFCEDGSLIGTLSSKTKNDIKKYFNFFSKLPNIEVLDKKYNINKVSKDVYINTAFITWKWDGLKHPVTVRMTFIFKNDCIFQLHSSIIPEKNVDLYELSGVF